MKKKIPVKAEREEEYESNWHYKKGRRTWKNCSTHGIRRNKGINFGDPMEIFTSEDGIVLRRFETVDDALSVAKRLKEILDNEKNPQYKKQIIDKVEGYIEAVKCDISEKEKLFEK